MSQLTNLIDFTELISNVPGEGLEELVRKIGQKKGLSPSWSGRGADGGRDLLFTERLIGPLTTEKITWLVSCKDKARSNQAVGERDLPTPSIKDKLAQHKANGFLLVTTTTISTGAKSLLDSLDKSKGGDIHTLVWDSSELIAMLLDLEFHDILRQFLPNSYQRVKGLTSLEGAVLSFREQLPEEVLNEIMRLVRPFSEAALRGAIIWPFDRGIAETIDSVVKELLINEDTETAAALSEGITVDALTAFINRLHNEYEDECRDYLLLVAINHKEADIRFNTAQFLFENYELDSNEQITVASHLDADAIAELYSGEISVFVSDELTSNFPEYEIFQALDELSQGTDVEAVYVERIMFTTDTESRRINFSGEFTLDATFTYEREEMGGQSFPGTFSGYFDEHGMYIEETTIDTSEF